MVRIVLQVEVADWPVEVTTEPMSLFTAELIMLELSRQPNMHVQSARLIEERGETSDE
jgi:hypothetical protein